MRIRAMTSATLAPDAKVSASIGIAVSRLNASFISLIILSVRPRSTLAHSIADNQSPDGLENCFVKTALKVLAANELRRPGRVPDEGPQHPRNLAAQEQIHGQPGHQNVARDPGLSGPLAQHGQEAEVSSDASPGDEEGEHHLEKAIFG